MKVLVVDDEAPARRRIIRMLTRIADVEVAGEACDGLEAKQRIAADRPDVVLLDIHMPGLDGLSLVAGETNLPPIIFTTAHDAYAVRAFELRAMDYLLKPIAQDRLELALARIHPASDDSDALGELIGQLSDRTHALTTTLTARVRVREGGTTRFFDAREITRFHAADKYTVFNVGDRELIIDESLTSLGERLADSGFLRIHRSELVNLAKVTAVHTTDGGAAEVELEGGLRLPVSRRLLPELNRALTR